jgi:hypothetical protein
MLQELTNLREGSLSFTDDPSFLSHDETRDIIAYNMFALISCCEFLVFLCLYVNMLYL